MRSFYEFFAGGGMARAGLGEGWTCLFANDFDAKKAETYRANYPGTDVLRESDVRKITSKDLPGRADLIWGSFPCQDLSLAGGGAGLKGERSGTFYPFWKIVEGLVADNRGPKVIALENVLGTLTSHRGRDFEAICKSFADAGYRYGALVINAALFVPQSRPRLFIIGVRKDVEISPDLLSQGPIEPFHTPALQRAFDRVGNAALKRRVWWNVPTPDRRNQKFADLIEEKPRQRPVAYDRPARPTDRHDVAGEPDQAGEGEEGGPQDGGRDLQAHTTRRKRGQGTARRGAVRRRRRLSAHARRRIEPPGDHNRGWP